MAMKVADYINAFMDPASYRNRSIPSVNGSLRVVLGPHCRLLVKTPRGGRGKYADTLVCAIDFGDGIKFWFEGFKYDLQYHTRRFVNWSQAKELPRNIISNVDNIKESGVVGKTDTHVLIEFGETSYLGTLEPNGEVKQLQLLPRRFSDIEVAVKFGITPQENEINILNEWIAEVQPVGFEPPKFPDEYAELLSAPLNPLDFGFTLDECVSNSAGSAEWRNPVLHPASHVIRHGPQARATAWTKAAEERSRAGNALNKRFPADYCGLSVNKSRWDAYGGERIGTIIVTSNGVYVHGEIREATRTKTQVLPGWCKLGRRIEVYKALEV